MPYAFQIPEEEKDLYARAYGREMPISRKWAYELANAIRGLMLQDAKRLLEDVIAKRRPIPVRRYTDSVSHRKGKVGPGKYPVKAARFFLKVLKNVEANAEDKGLDPDRLKLVHVSAYKGRTEVRFKPRAFGRSTPIRRETVNLEVVVKEVE